MCKVCTADGRQDSLRFVCKVCTAERRQDSLLFVCNVENVYLQQPEMTFALLAAMLFHYCYVKLKKCIIANKVMLFPACL